MPTIVMETPTRAVRTGRVLSALALLFLTFDCVVKVLELPQAVEATVALGYPASAVAGIGVIELACLALYAVPRTSLLGAILMTGYLGGAIATHVRVDSPLLTHTLFPLYVAVALWGGLALRDRGVRELVRRR